MARRNIVNERILNMIKEISGNDAINEFLTELIFDEAEHSNPNRPWKGFYKSKVEESARRWRETDEINSIKD